MIYESISKYDGRVCVPDWTASDLCG